MPVDGHEGSESRMGGGGGEGMGDGGGGGGGGDDEIVNMVCTRVIKILSRHNAQQHSSKIRSRYRSSR